MLYFKYLFISFLIVVLSSCGSGGQSINLPEKRPNGSIEGLVLGGLYSGGTITAYSLNDADSRQFIASSPVQEDGSFNLVFASQSQPIVIEVRGGTYLDPSNFNTIDTESDFIMSKTLMFNSGEVHAVSVTPFTHFITGLVLYLNENNSDLIDTTSLEAANKEFKELYSISDAALSMSLDENAGILNIEGDERHGLLISALAKIALDERLKKSDELKDLYHLSSLNSLMYEDIRSDGVLDGKSLYQNNGGIKTLAYGDQIIDFNFYRLKLAFAMQKSLDKVSLLEFSERNEQEDFILAVAQSESALFEETNNVALDELVPEIHLVSDVPKVVNKEYLLSFTVDKSLKLSNIDLKVDGKDLPPYEKELLSFPPSTIYNTSAGYFSIPVATTAYLDGPHELSIVVSDTFNHTGNIQIPITFDNTAPLLDFEIADSTFGSKYLLKGTADDEFSSVKKITVDGEEVDFPNGKNWEQQVTLVSGSNSLLIEIEDELGNYESKNTEIFYDDTESVVIVTSASITKTNQFLLEGLYMNAESGISSITINGSDANVDVVDNKWSKSVFLSSGENEFEIGIIDNAGNDFKNTTTVLLDDLSPLINVTSKVITNVKEFLLEGEYIERESGINRITVNDSEATVLDDGSWSKSVTLNSNSNIFVIAAEDDAGNYTEITTEVILYEEEPVVLFTSRDVTNNVEFTLAGEFDVGDFNLGTSDDNNILFTVNDEVVTDILDKQWTKSVLLQEGINHFVVKIEDDVGNYAEYTTEVVLDILPPVIEYLTPIAVRFSNDNGTFDEGLLTLEDNVKPIYIETNGLALSGMEVNNANLTSGNIPYFSFKFYDQVFDGLETKVEELKVEYKYSINDFIIMPWQVNTFAKDNNEWLFPIVEETLSAEWYKVNPTDVHNLQIRVTDKAGNVTTQQATFKAQFYVPELKLEVIEGGADSLSQGTYANREEYIDGELIIVNYTLKNPLDNSIKINISDDSSHSVVQKYDKVKRENKYEKHTQEVWRAATIKDLNKDKCPKIDGSTDVKDWPDINKLWNFNNGSWHGVTPEFKLQTIFNQDTPGPKQPTPWVDFKADDTDADFYKIERSRYTLLYDFDYILDYIEGEEPLPSESRPTLVKSILLTKRDVPQLCPNIYAVKTRWEYKYIQAVGYPRRDIGTVTKKAEEFSNARFVVRNEDGTEILPQQGWYEVPKNTTVTIEKYAQTPSLDVYKDTSVIDPNSIFDYKLHRLDNEWKWTIEQKLTVITQFNPGNILDEFTSVKQMVKPLSFTKKQTVFNRN